MYRVLVAAATAFARGRASSYVSRLNAPLAPGWWPVMQWRARIGAMSRPNVGEEAGGAADCAAKAAGKNAMSAHERPAHARPDLSCVTDITRDSMLSPGHVGSDPEQATLQDARRRQIGGRRASRSERGDTCSRRRLERRAAHREVIARVQRVEQVCFWFELDPADGDALADREIELDEPRRMLGARRHDGDAERRGVHPRNDSGSDDASTARGVPGADRVRGYRSDRPRRAEAVDRDEVRSRVPALRQRLRSQQVARERLERAADIYAPGQRIRPGQLELRSPGMPLWL